MYMWLSSANYSIHKYQTACISETKKIYIYIHVYKQPYHSPELAVSYRKQSVFLNNVNNSKTKTLQMALH